MIDRSVLQTDDLTKFDYFNDTKDTISWLNGCLFSPTVDHDKVHSLIDRIEKGNKEFIKEWVAKMSNK